MKSNLERDEFIMTKEKLFAKGEGNDGKQKVQ